MENSNLPLKTTGTFFSKIKIAIKSLFSKKVKSHKNTENETTQSAQDNTYVAFVENLQQKADTEKTFKEDTVKYIVDIVEQDPSTLESLTIEQLEDVNDYYAEQIEVVDREISKIKKRK